MDDADSAATAALHCGQSFSVLGRMICGFGVLDADCFALSGFCCLFCLKNHNSWAKIKNRQSKKIIL
jgi:hypothetical protein